MRPRNDVIRSLRLLQTIRDTPTPRIQRMMEIADVHHLFDPEETDPY